MRSLILLLITLPLFSCGDANVDDLNDFVAKAKVQIYPVNDNVPDLKKIDAMIFTQEEGRNPFSEPKMEVAAPVRNAPKSCPQPDFERKKQPLEMYSLDNLIMRGTLRIDNILWALVQITGGELHKVKLGYYLGLNHGKVLKITKEKVELLELVSDKDGCWQERITQITLQSD
ncbi:pilus assembly protein PilP [Psychromonas antarctica]|jgi:type IV pilus assembly protein PilP|uniref:pilus assembly protein PilP n=1 Tax=Psychromonas antarctica TaxID=67573 RepID=UPI001EE7F500|nr:pilus assembly protein PilP [Psychromonas antarctica]MCG6200707.1 pilus assembly protein PilP [Psychromonas antarctica]